MHVSLSLLESELCQACEPGEDKLANMQFDNTREGVLSKFNIK